MTTDYDMDTNQNNKVARLAMALCLAQADIKDAKTNKKNAYIGNSYADLTAVWQACRAALTKNDLAVVQRFKDDNRGTTYLETLLIHTSGESISSELPLMNVKDWHSMGSAITYARRYSLCALVGIAPDGEDDDGAAAQAGTKKAPTAGSRKSYPKRKKQEGTIKDQAMAILEEVPEADEYLRNKDVDPADPPEQILETIVKLGAAGIRKKIKEAEAKKIADEADRVEPLEEEGGDK
tara:strand:+ start:2060 stop:2770 length:711 start_codon:yes stop_codon:yes gene_type:complete